MKGVRRLTLREDRDMYRRFALAMGDDPRRQLCGVVCACGPDLVPLACAYRPQHPGPHSWANLPTWEATQQEAP